MRHIAALTLLLLFLSSVAHGDAENSSGVVHANDEPQILASQVRTIFEAKCVECHGSNLTRPKGKFGYILDLARVAANPDYIVPGDPEESDLYQMVDDEEMPGKKATAPPLTAEEKQIVKHWIERGAPDVKHAEFTSAQMPAATAKPVARPVPRRKFTFRPRAIRFLGQFHPPSSHFPIALLIAAIPAEFMWKRTRKHSWKSTVRFCVMLGAASAVLTATLGWCDAAFSNYTGNSAPLLAWHRWLGTATAVWAVLTALLSEFAHKEGHPRGLRYFFRFLLLAGVVLVIISGYLGASLIYGLDHFKW